MRLIRATLQLIRADSTLLSFLSVFIPVFARTNNLDTSLAKALPLLFVSMCTFIINDLDDIEKDKINHPQRPLPSGQVKPAFVATLYYVCLALALLTVRYLIEDSRIAFWYYLLLTLSISYRCVVEHLLGLKSLYVAGAASIPILIIVRNFPERTGLYYVAAAVFLFTLGRELCMDICDRPGDPISPLSFVKSERIATLAFVFQGAGLALLSVQIAGWAELIDLSFMIALFASAYQFWFKLRRQNIAIALMKSVLFLGLYFLL
jgi:geranylgeranylglycerol-phosphate geranylgeranyltransferase